MKKIKSRVVVTNHENPHNPLIMDLEGKNELEIVLDAYTNYEETYNTLKYGEQDQGDLELLDSYAEGDIESGEFISKMRHKTLFELVNHLNGIGCNWWTIKE